MRTYEIKVQRVSLGQEDRPALHHHRDHRDRHREKVLKSLLRELSHRSKNLLAIIQGIATQTARNTLSLDSFLVKFRGRLAVSVEFPGSDHRLSSWRGAFLFELTQKQFAPYWPDTVGPLPVTGLNVHLTPNAAVHVGLALHELIVNSATFGAIAGGAPSVTLDCQETILSDRKAIRVSWVEMLPNANATHEFSDNSFGRIVLERVVPSSVNGKADLRLTPGTHRVSPADPRLRIRNPEARTPAGRRAADRLPQILSKRKQPVRGRRTGCFTHREGTVSVDPNGVLGARILGRCDHRSDIVKRLDTRMVPVRRSKRCAFLNLFCKAATPADRCGLFHQLTIVNQPAN
jgi:two-component sensor histidine kinase